MLSVETLQPATSMNQPSSPRISFSSEFLDDSNFISITPKPLPEPGKGKEKQKYLADFEFLSNNNIASSHAAMLTADELFFEGKILPFWQTQQSEKLNNISIKTKENNEKQELQQVKEETRVWFVDDDPSPRPPNCTVLWKELLRLKKQRSSSFSSSSSCSSSSLADVAVAATSEEGKEGSKKAEKSQGKRMKKGLERTRSATIRIRPMVNVPICSQMKTSDALPPLLPLKKGRR